MLFEVMKLIFKTISFLLNVGLEFILLKFEEILGLKESKQSRAACSNSLGLFSIQI